MKNATATFAGSAASPAQFPRDGLPEVAFLGRSNVGKSSLLNALAGTRGLARVSSEPGRTRVVNFFRVTGVQKTGGAGRGDLYLVDLPGYGYARAPRDVREEFERIAVSYLAGRPSLRLCVFIVDARHEPTGRDETLRDWLEHHGLPASAVVGVSAEKGFGLDELWNVIRAAAFARDERATIDDVDANPPKAAGDHGR